MSLSTRSDNHLKISSTKNELSKTEDFLLNHAFDNSFQANVISTVSSGALVIVNKAAVRLFGYSKTEFLSKNRSDIFDIKEASFKKMLKHRAKKGKSSALVTCIQKNGKRIPCEITSAVFMDMNGVEKSVTTIVDRRRQILKQKAIDKINQKKTGDNNLIEKASSASKMAIDKWIKYIGKASYDVMWDWDIASGKIYVGDSLEEVFGHKVQNNTISFSEFLLLLVPQQRMEVENRFRKILASGKKIWSDSYSLKRNDGSVAFTTSRAIIIRDKDGKAVRLIGAIQDISRLKALELQLKEQTSLHKEESEKFILAARQSFDVIWDWDIKSKKVYIGDGFEELFGYFIKDNVGVIDDWSNHLHPNDKAEIEAGLFRAINSPATQWEQGYRFLRSDGTSATVFSRGNIIRSANGEAYRMIGAMHDLSIQNTLEEKLEQEIKLKKKQIEDITEETKETERSDIGKELHDNVNQLLGASNLYLDMGKRGGKDSEMYLSRSAEYTRMAIEEIRKLTKGLTTDIIKNLGLCVAIENIARDTMEVQPIKIEIALGNFKENTVKDKFKLNIFRIIQEQLNNVLKHANATLVRISLNQNAKSINLSISDNGVGFDTDKKKKGIGITNIKSRAADFNGIADFVSQNGKGCFLTVTFPVVDAVLA